MVDKSSITLTSRTTAGCGPRRTRLRMSGAPRNQGVRLPTGFARDRPLVRETDIPQRPSRARHSQEWPAMSDAALRRIDDLVYDVGMGNGDDSAYYLHEGIGS